MISSDNSFFSGISTGFHARHTVASMPFLPMGESVLLVFMQVLFFIRAAFSSSEARIFWRAYDVVLEVFSWHC